MLISCKNRELNFSIDAPPSKSIYHRELIIRFLCGETDRLEPVAGDNDDVLATKACLKALLSAKNHRETPASLSPDRTNDIYLPCNESGSVLRVKIPTRISAPALSFRPRVVCSTVRLRNYRKLFSRTESLFPETKKTVPSS